jgi:hypothetical protein
LLEESDVEHLGISHGNIVRLNTSQIGCAGTIGLIKLYIAVFLFIYVVRPATQGGFEPINMP